MKITFDKQSNMLNIQFKEEVSAESAELEQGVVIDYNAKGEIVGIEIEDAHKFDLSKFSFETLNENQKIVG
jgi:uncharacterized protein YuzE